MRTERAGALLALLVGFTLWLFSHHYDGIVNDARLYILMAVRWLTPTAYARDLMFMFGSQDDFSVFSPLLAQAVRILGIAQGAMTAVLVGAGCWLMAVFSLTRAVLGPRCYLPAFLLLLSTPFNYSPGVPLELTESFVSARPFAMSLALLGVAVAIRGRFAIGLALGLGATAIHPLMGVWSLILVVFGYLGERQLLRLVVMAAALCLLAAINPLGLAMLMPMTGEWEAIVHVSPMVFLPDWPVLRADTVLWWIAMLLWGGRLGSPTMRYWYQCVALIGAAGFLFSLVAAKFLPIVFFLQVQAWRGLWLVTVIAVVAAVDVGLQQWNRSPVHRSLLVISAASFLLRECGGGALLLTAYFFAPTLIRIERSIPSGRVLLLTRVGWGLASVVLLLCLPALLLDTAINADLDIGNFSDNIGKWLLALWILLRGGVLALVGWWLLSERQRATVAVILTAPTLVWAASTWDTRPEYTRYIENRYRIGGNQTSFGGRIKLGQTVYWYQGTMRIWFEIGTSSYANAEHSIGMVFSERRALELQKRLAKVALKASEPDKAGRLPPDRVLWARYWFPRQGEQKHQPYLFDYEASGVTRSGLERLCADPELDYVVESDTIDKLWVAEQIDTIGGREQRFYLYDCRNLNTKWRN